MILYIISVLRKLPGATVGRMAIAHCDKEKPVHCLRWRTEQTSLYQLIQAHSETFYTQVEAETEHGLPAYVKAEFDAFLDCGMLANGFLRLGCEVLSTYSAQS